MQLYIRLFILVGYNKIVCVIWNILYVIRTNKLGFITNNQPFLTFLRFSCRIKICN